MHVYKFRDILVPHDFFLIDGNGKEISIPKQDNLEMTGYFLKGRKNHRIASLYLKSTSP